MTLQLNAKCEEYIYPSWRPKLMLERLQSEPTKERRSLKTDLRLHSDNLIRPIW